MKFKVKIPSVSLHFRNAKDATEMKRKSKAEMKRSFKYNVPLKDIVVTPWYDDGITVGELKQLLSNVPNDAKFLCPVDGGTRLHGARYDKENKEVVIEFHLWPNQPS